MADYEPKKYLDGFASLEGGMNSGIAPMLLKKNQYGFGLNTSIRGGFIKTRPPIQKKTLNYNGDAALQAIVEGGNFQGCGYYRPDFGVESLLAQISGHLIQFKENGAFWDVTDVSIDGDLNSATANQVWMWQSEKWMIIQDGTGALPIFFDGVTSRRSYGPSVKLAIASSLSPIAPPGIGETVIATVTTPYTGPLNVPVIMNGEFYQIGKGDGFQGADIELILTHSSPITISVGSQVVVNPQYTTYVSIPSGVGKYGSGPSPVYVADSSQIMAGHILNLDPVIETGVSVCQVEVLSVSGNVLTVQATALTTSNVRIRAGAPVLDISITRPSFIVGTVTTAGTYYVSESKKVELSAPYVGPDVFCVIEKDLYVLRQHVDSDSETTVSLVNLTDNSSSNYTTPLNIYSVPELPAGRMGAYGMGCNAMSLADGISYIIGDVVGSSAGSPANNYRDAVLKVTQNTYLFNGGSFRLPGAGDIINSVSYPPNLDTSLGQGALQIGTQFGMFSNVLPGTDPATWETVKFPIQTESLKGSGPLSHNSLSFVNSDSFFRSDSGISSLVIARRDFNEWGNRTVSNEMTRILSRDDESLLQFASSSVFNNRFLCTAAPYYSALGVFHVGLVSMNFDLLSSLSGSIPPAWEGVWSGVNALQLVNGRVNGENRQFAFTYNSDSNRIELFEFLPENTTEYKDNGTNSIVWVFETPVMMGTDIKPMTELVRLRDGEVYLNNIKGDVNVKVYYKPDYYPCWTLWREFDVCQNPSASNAKAGYRTEVGLGEPSPETGEAKNNRPMRVGNFFQLRFEITGCCTINGVKVAAITEPQPTFAPIEISDGTCQAVNCDVPDDLRIYSIQGLPPQPTVPVESPPLLYSNDEVYYSQPCGDGYTLVYNGVLPTWIAIDQVNEKLIGAAGVFWGATKDEATAAAQAELDAFAAAGLESNKLECFSCGSVTENLADMAWTIGPPLDTGNYLTDTPPVPLEGGFFGGYASNQDICFWGGGEFGSHPTGTILASAQLCNNTNLPRTVRATWRTEADATGGPVGGSNTSWNITVNSTMMFSVEAGVSDVYPQQVPPPHADIVIPPYSIGTISILFTKTGPDAPTTYGTLHFADV